MSLAPRALSLVLALLPAAGCALPGAHEEPLAALQHFPVTCAGGFGLPVPALGTGWTPSDADRTGPMVDASVRLARIDWSTARELFGDDFAGAEALAVPSDTGRALLERLGASEPTTDTRLTVFEGSLGEISVSNQCAYISGFEIQGQRGVMIADPVVSQVQEGDSIALRPSRGDAPGTWKLDLSLAWVRLERPIGARTLDLAPGGTEISIQQPLFHHMTVHTEAELAQDQSLVLAGFETGREGRIVLAVVTVGELTPPVRALPSDAPVTAAALPGAH